MPSKKSLLVGAAVATVTLGGLGSAGLVSAAVTATDNSDTSKTSVVDKIASKFNLNKAEVQAVFDEDRKSHAAKRSADQATRLAAAVKDGQITQGQADYITNALAEIDKLRTSSSADSSTHSQIKTKMDALRSWATDNKVDMQFIGHGGHGGGPRGGGDSPRD